MSGYRCHGRETTTRTSWYSTMSLPDEDEGRRAGRITDRGAADRVRDDRVVLLRRNVNHVVHDAEVPRPRTTRVVAECHRLLPGDVELRDTVRVPARQVQPVTDDLQVCHPVRPVTGPRDL